MRQQPALDDVDALKALVLAAYSLCALWVRSFFDESDEDVVEHPPAPVDEAVEECAHSTDSACSQ